MFVTWIISTLLSVNTKSGAGIVQKQELNEQWLGLALQKLIFGLWAQILNP